MEKSYKIPEKLIHKKDPSTVTMSFRLTQETSNNITKLAEANNLKKTDVLKIAVENLIKQTN